MMSFHDEAMMAAMKKKRSRPRRRPQIHNGTKNSTKVVGGALLTYPYSSSSSSISGAVSESSFSSSSERSQRRSSQRQRRTKPPRMIMSQVPFFHPYEQYLAMDCEMVGAGEGGFRSILARVTIVNWNCEIVYDTFVRPTEPVTDYRTFVSGVTAADIYDTEEDDKSDTSTTTTTAIRTSSLVDLQTCRTHVKELINDKILIGHALKNDLEALMLFHPWQCTRDTAKYEPFMKQRFDDGILWPRKLKDLVWEQLQLTIQWPGQPHSAWEDAVSALQLYQCVQPQWEHTMQHKIRKSHDIIMERHELSATATAWTKSLPAVAIQA